MFRSLHARRWLSYALLIVTALVIVALVLIAFLLRSPLLYRSLLARLDAAQTLLASGTPATGDMQQTARAFGVRVLRFSQDGQLLQDTGANQAALSLPALKLRAARAQRDAAGKPWFYSVRQLPDGTWLLVAAQRPK